MLQSIPGCKQQVRTVMAVRGWYREKTLYSVGCWEGTRGQRGGLVSNVLSQVWKLLEWRVRGRYGCLLCDLGVPRNVYPEEEAKPCLVMDSMRSLVL